MVEIPKLPTKKCGFGTVPVAVFVYHTVLGFPVPIAGVNVQFKYTPFPAEKPQYQKTGSDGLAEACYIVGTYANVIIQKDGIDFGGGKGVPLNAGTSAITLSPKMFTAKAKIGCSDINFSQPSIAASNFKFDATPNVTVLPVNLSTPVGSLTIKSGTYLLYINGKQIGSGSIPDSGKINHNLKSLKDIPEIKDLFGKTAELKIEITAGECMYTGTKQITLPSLPALCSGTLGVKTPTGLSIKDHIADYLSKIKIGTSPLAFPPLYLQIESVVNGVKKDIAIELQLDGNKVTLDTPKSNRSQDLIRIIKTLGTKAFDTAHDIKIIPLIDCAIDPVSFSIPALIPELPKPTACGLWETAANVSLPSILKPPFTLKVSNANWICKDTGKKTLIDAIARVSIGDREFSLPIKGGSGILTLPESDLAGIIGTV